MDNPVFKSYYPDWPWVDLGTRANDPACNLKLPEPIDDERLVDVIAVGRHLSRTPQTIDTRKTFQMWVEYFFVDPEEGNNPFHGQKPDNTSALMDEWTVTDTTSDLDNRQTLRLTGTTVSTFSQSTVTGKAVDRSFDYIMSVLESLPVGYKESPRIDEMQHLKWTVNSIMYPHGPNIRIHFEQNKSYNPWNQSKNASKMLPVCYCKSWSVWLVVH